MLVPDRAGPVTTMGAGTGTSEMDGSRGKGVDDQQPGLQVTQHVVAGHQPAQGVQVRFGVQGSHQPAKRFLPRRRPEVVKPGGSHGGLDQLVRLQ